MNTSELKTLFKAELPANPATDAEILVWFNSCCLDMVRRTHCLRTSATASTVANQQEYSLPADCMMIDPTGGVTLKNSAGNWIRLEATTMAWLDQHISNWRNASADSPKGYYKKGQIIGLHPKPNSDGTDDIRIYYIDKPNTLVNDTDVPLEKDDSLVQYHSLIVSYALWKCRQKMGKFSQAEIYKSEYLTGIAEMTRDIVVNPDNQQVIRPYNRVGVSGQLSKSNPLAQ